MCYNKSGDIVKYLKLLDGENSHAGGFSYKIGEVNVANNWNPQVDNPKDFGGFNFSTEDKIFRWLIRGNVLYDVEIPEDAEIVEVENKNAPHGVFRTNKILLKNPRKVDDALALDLYYKSDLPLNTYFQCLCFLCLKGYTDVCFQILQDKVNPSNVEQAIQTFSTFLEVEEKDKNDCYKEILRQLEEIKNKL